MLGLKPLPQLTKEEFLQIDLKKINWVLQDGIAMPFLSYYPEICVTTDLQKYGWPFNLVIAIYYDNGLMSWNFDRDLMEKYATNILELYLKDQKELHKINKIWQGYYKKYNQTYQNFIKKILPNFSELSDKKLWREFVKFNQNYVNEYTPALTTEFFSAYGDRLLNEISYKTPEHISDAITLSTPIKPSFLQNEKIDALIIASKSNVNKKNDLENHQQKYFWVYNNYRETEPLSIKYFQSEIEKLQKSNPKKELQKIKNDLRKLRIKQKEITKRKIFNRETQLALGLISFCSHWQDQRKEANLKANFVLNEFLKEFSKRLNINLNDLHYATPYELKDAFLTGTDISKLVQLRKKFFCRITVPNKELFLTGNEAQKILNIFEKIKNPSQKIKEIKGVSASLGYVKGKARIILDAKLIGNFQKGDILVTGMTRPEFVPLMKKASAIITDEGGLTCHAAIISRELGIPCIIGTKIATKVFKDGNLVEVDADKGIVRKL